MKILIVTETIEEVFEVNIINLIQLYDYLKNNRKEIFKEVSTKELCYVVYDESKEKAYPILPSMLDFDISSYAFLVIAPKVSGEAFFTSVAMATAATVAGTTAAAATAAAAAGTLVATVGLGAAIAGYAVATIVTVGLIIGLGMLIRALTPQNKLDNNTDPANMSKLFNGVPNITEQGGSVPIIFGNCLYGGVRIGLKFEVAQSSYDDVVNVHNFAEIQSIPSTWLKFI